MNRYIFNPLAVFIAVWSIAIILFYLMPFAYDIRLNSIIKILGYFVVSSTGYFVSRVIFKGLSIKYNYYPSYRILSRIGLAVAFILSFKVLHITIDMIASDNLSNYFYYKRVETLAYGKSLSLLEVVYGQFLALSISFSIYWYIYNCFFRVRSLTLYLIIMMVLLSTVYEGGRSVSVIYIIVLFFSWALVKRPSVKHIALYSFFIIGLFLVSTYYMRVTSEVLNSGEAFKNIFEQLFIYVFSGVKGYDIYSEEGIRIFHSQLNSILENIAPFQMDFVDVALGMRTNVFSGLAVYEYYFGVFFSYFFMFVVFFLFGALFSMKSKSVLCYGLKSFALTTTFLMVFHDYFIPIIPYLVRFLLVCIVFSFFKCEGKFRPLSRQ